MKFNVPGVLHQEEHLTADDEAAKVKEEALKRFIGALSRLCVVAGSAVHCGEDKKQNADPYGADSENQEGMGRADDLDVESVGRVPPVVERGRGDHGDAAPCGDEGTQRRP